MRDFDYDNEKIVERLEVQLSKIDYNTSPDLRDSLYNQYRREFKRCNGVYPDEGDFSN